MFTESAVKQFEVHQNVKFLVIFQLSNWILPQKTIIGLVNETREDVFVQNEMEN